MANVNQEIDTIRVGNVDYEISDPHALYGEHDESAPDLTDVPLYESDLVTQVTNDSTKPSAANVPYQLKQEINQISSDLTSVNHAIASSHANVTASSVFCYSVGNIVVVSGWLKVNTVIPAPASNTVLVTFANTMPFISDNHRAFFAAVNSADDTVRAMKVYQRSILLDSKNIPAGDYTINGVCIV